MYLNDIYSKTMPDDYGYVYYDANGGSVTYRVQAFMCDNNTAPAADAAKIGDSFIGWYTDLTGGTQVTALTRDLTGKTLFARWQSSENTEAPDSDADSVSVTVKVTGDVVNIRNGPGTNYTTAKQVTRNTVLTVSHVTHLTNMKWGKVPGGWICLDFTNYDAVVNGGSDTDTEDDKMSEDGFTVPENQPEWTEPDPDVSTDNETVISGYVNVNDFLNIRSGPGTTYPSVGFLFRNTKVEIREQRTAGNTVWGRIEKGWISMDYIVTDKLPADGSTASGTEQNNEPQQKPSDSVGNVEAASVSGIITADALRVRSGPGTTNSIVGFYYQNDRVTVSEKVLVGSVYWGKTNKGWISMEYVQADSSSGESSQPAEDDRNTIIADCLRIRKEPGTEHKIVAFLYYGDKVTVLETKDVNGTLWGRVDKGWISMDYVN